MNKFSLPVRKLVAPIVNATIQLHTKYGFDTKHISLNYVALEVCEGHVSRVRVQQRGGRVTHVRGQGGTRAPGQTLSPGNTQSPHQASPRPGPWLATGNRYFEVKLNQVSVNITFY